MVRDIEVGSYFPFADVTQEGGDILVLCSGCANGGTTNCWPKSTRMWGAGLPTQTANDGCLLGSKVASNSRCDCAMDPWVASNIVKSTRDADMLLSGVSTHLCVRDSEWLLAHIVVVAGGS